MLDSFRDHPFRSVRALASALPRSDRAGRLATNVRIALIAYPILFGVIFGAATVSALLDPSLLKPAVPAGRSPLDPNVPLPPLSPVGQECFDRAYRDLAEATITPETRRALAALVAMGCLDRALTAQSSEQPSTPKPQ